MLHALHSCFALHMAWWTHYVNMHMQYTVIFHRCKKLIFRWKKKVIFFLFLLKIDCGYNLCFRAKIRKKNEHPGKPQFPIKLGARDVHYTDMFSWCDMIIHLNSICMWCLVVLINLNVFVYIFFIHVIQLNFLRKCDMTISFFQF